MRTAWIDEVETRIVATRQTLAAGRAFLVGISGIDASGKGFIAAKFAQRLRAGGRNLAFISADAWLNLPQVCLSERNRGEHFYEHALRLEEMFERLILPLRDERDVDLVADRGDAKATLHCKHRFLLSRHRHRPA